MLSLVVEMTRVICDFIPILLNLTSYRSNNLWLIPFTSRRTEKENKLRTQSKHAVQKLKVQNVNTLKRKKLKNVSLAIFHHHHNSKFDDFSSMCYG